MPYNPSERFDPSLIFRGVMGAGDALGGGIADAIKKKEQAEAQMAGSMFGFQTLKKAGLIDPEEETKFLQGNANQRNAIVMAATPRLLEKFRTQKEQNDIQQAAMQRDLQLKIAEMHYRNNGAEMQSPVVDPRTGLMWNGRQWVKPPTSSDSWHKNMAVARGRLKSDGTFDNQYAGAEQGDMVKLMTPEGKEVVVPWSAYQGRTEAVPNPAVPAPQMPATAPQAAAPALNAQDQQALAWAKSNPQDPRSAAILKKLGVQ